MAAKKSGGVPPKAPDSTARRTINAPLSRPGESDEDLLRNGVTATSLDEAASSTLADLPSGSAEAYAKYLPIALTISADVITSYRGDPALAYHNINTGLTALAPREAELANLPKPFSLDAMKALPALALATRYAAAQVDLASKGIIRQLRERATVVRTLLLSSAVTLMNSRDLPAPEVQRIIKGKGLMDMAQDCVDLAELFKANKAKVASKSPVTDADIEEASTVGNQLLALIKPKTTPRQARSKVHPEVAKRDALGTLLLQQWALHLRKAGMWIWGDEVDSHVPPLHSHVGHKKKAPDDEEEETIPAATGTAKPATSGTATAGTAHETIAAATHEKSATAPAESATAAQGAAPPDGAA